MCLDFQLFFHMWNMSLFFYYHAYHIDQLLKIPFDTRMKCLLHIARYRGNRRHKACRCVRQMVSVTRFTPGGAWILPSSVVRLAAVNTMCLKVTVKGHGTLSQLLVQLHGHISYEVTMGEVQIFLLKYFERSKCIVFFFVRWEILLWRTTLVSSKFESH